MDTKKIKKNFRNFYNRTKILPKQTTKAFLPKMIENDRGHIATIASLAGHVGISKLVDYCASKFAAVSIILLKLHCNVISPSTISQH